MSDLNLDIVGIIKEPVPQDSRSVISVDQQKPLDEKAEYPGQELKDQNKTDRIL